MNCILFLVLNLDDTVLFLRFNCGKAEALQALDDIYHRACYNCYCEVILLANAIKNSCQGYFDGQL